MGNDLKERVATRLAESGPKVADMVVDSLVEAELDKRSGIIHAGLRKVDELRKERRKLDGPDSVTFVEGEGGATTEVKAISKARMDQRKKLDGDIARVEGLIDSALGETDAQKQAQSYDALDKACKSNGGGSDGGGNKS